MGPWRVQTSTESLSELNDLRKQLEAAQRQLAATRTSPPPGTEELSQGRDEADLDVTIDCNVAAKDSQYGSARNYRWEVAPTWDEVFSALGPDLLDEGEQRALRKALNGWLTRRFRDDAAKAVEDAVLEEGETVYNIELRVQRESFGTLIVQLRALGLITRGQRKRSVNDRGTYWALTPYGDDHLTTLRAITREAADARTADSSLREKTATATATATARIEVGPRAVAQAVERADASPDARGKLERYGPGAFVLLGVAMIIVAAIGYLEPSVSVAFVAVGAGLMALGGMTARIEGTVKIGVQGFEFALRARQALVEIQREAETTDPEEAKRIGEKLDELDDWFEQYKRDARHRQGLTPWGKAMLMESYSAAWKRPTGRYSGGAVVPGVDTEEPRPDTKPAPDPE